ncbi:hypothetical protein [Paenibacillus sp. SN-8-1]|uniref:hypothetical protein n=1 Tax=Paenibacillus sp. SN-8-1 TaxID=3435409 RepID=UPI003D9A5390
MNFYNLPCETTVLMDKKKEPYLKGSLFIIYKVATSPAEARPLYGILDQKSIYRDDRVTRFAGYISSF